MFLSVSISVIGCAGAAAQVEGFSPPPPGAGAGLLPGFRQCEWVEGVEHAKGPERPADSLMK